MTQNQQSHSSDVEAILQTTDRHERWLRDARRFHTKNLFGLWLLLGCGLSIPVLLILVREGSPLLVPLSGLLILLVILTGAYTFQEVARLHKRLDAILRLIEKQQGP